ncbi:hypothetical protein DFAR_1260049 [Desulfarculales bacterium]
MAALKQEAIIAWELLLALGLALQPPWRLMGQRVDTDKQSPMRSFWRLPPTGEPSTPIFFSIIAT